MKYFSAESFGRLKKKMYREITIRLIEKIKKPAEVNKFLNGILTFLIIVFFPLIIIVGLSLMLVMWTWNFLKFGNPQKTEVKIDQTSEEQWSDVTNINYLKIQRRYLHEIRFGPAFFELKSEPKIDSLDNKTFGDWFYRRDSGVFLQQLNSTSTPNTNLIFIDGKTLELKNIKENIPSVLWSITEMEQNKFLLKCDTGQEIMTYQIEI